ncbi:hypothetical protein PENDEC_c030G01801 [Penicillium decumbens]|uniref:Yeast cell wall synthesis Kre9/Knh1-like N-terminal domain-containing protein n=1 Tax=Penicillium decumbens TaxID=69771 RepID=A0A1V6NW81_PENDC|nr:hypothetical protein PENDEC_c030G01801 [Penicillium decumbens]
MRLSLAFSLVPLAVSVGAILVTEPKEGAEINPSSSFDVKWTSVDTDASSFNIYLVNNAVYPTINKKIASNIKTSTGSYTVDSIDASAGHGYRIDLMSDSTENSGILAQSQQFNVTISAQSSSSSSSTSTSTASSTEASTSTISTTTASTTTSTPTSTGTSPGTNGMATTPATSGTSISGSPTSTAANGTWLVAPTASTGAGPAVVAHPVVAAGLFAGVIAFTL